MFQGILANDNKGRDCAYSAEGASTFSVNLSGKKTLVGRNSGECFRYPETTKGESRSSVNFQVQGQRKLLYEKGFFCPFFMG
jgi:hypothetical protein